MKAAAPPDLPAFLLVLFPPLSPAPPVPPVHPVMAVTSTQPLPRLQWRLPPWPLGDPPQPRAPRRPPASPAVSLPVLALVPGLVVVVARRRCPVHQAGRLPIHRATCFQVVWERRQQERWDPVRRLPAMPAVQQPLVPIRQVWCV
ncbi:unnamed protein product [Protopolystoma xenopodis]|uniref:Uncharacterized protein n=1 Tax=Protopolystoma xenopodis TaxID=117903 RepID=A0A448XLX3_9PLAT|nr:unnamed protein product [Protopolystoma xenopodis]